CALDARGGPMRRREVITLLGGAAAPSLLWPLKAGAEQGDRRIGVLMATAAADPESVARIGAFQEELRQLGWSVGQNLRLDIRSGDGKGDSLRTLASELAALAPNALLAIGNPATMALRRATRSIPIVFTQVIDPVGAGIVASLGSPGGLITGYTIFELGSSGRLLALLKQIAPDAKRAAIIKERGDPGPLGLVG